MRERVGIRKKYLEITSLVIGISGTLIHVGILGFVQYLNEVWDVPYSWQVYRYVLMGVLSFYILLNITLLFGIWKKIQWILITWMAFAIFLPGLAFLFIHVSFYLSWATVLICVFHLIYTLFSIVTVEEFRFASKSGSSNSTQSVALELQE